MKETVTQQTATQDLEQARLNFVSLLHKLTKDIVEGKEDIIRWLIDFHAHKAQEKPISIDRVYDQNGLMDVPNDSLVSAQITTNGTGTITVSFNGRQFPYPVTKAGITQATVGNVITSVTVNGLNTGERCYVTYLNEKASLLGGK